MKSTTESTFLKFMAKVSKAIDSKNEITPEDITPEILDNDDFKQRLRLYGHSVEEIEQLIAEGKCIQISHGSSSRAIPDEDFAYIVDGNPFIFNGEEFNHIEQNIDYILFTSGEINNGILLKCYPQSHSLEYIDILNTFNLQFDEDGYLQNTYIGYNSL